VVRREPGGWKGVIAGVEVGDEWPGVPTIAIELVGLSLVSKPRPRGETVLGAVVVRKLFRNCCRASTAERCP
jgi:hypothetical protein